MNEKKHWDRVAPTYNEEIFDVFKSDTKKVVPRYVSKHGNPDHLAIDFGCGNGKAFPLLAPRFKNVWGIDISRQLLHQAGALPYENIVLRQADLTRSLRLPKADFIFCCNVAILPEVESNLAILKNIRKALQPGGSAVVVIPSLETMLFSSWRLIDWYKKENVKPEKIDVTELLGFSGKKTDILQGLVIIDDVVTKHYTREEIEVIFPRCGLNISKIEKVEYTWKSEFSTPPSWMKAPYPWDWLVECANGKPY